MKEILDIAKLSLFVVSPFAIIAIAWAIILKLITKKKKPGVIVKIPKIAPAYIARRVMFEEELKHLKPNTGDLAYVLKENQTYFYNGVKWNKVITRKENER